MYNVSSDYKNAIKSNSRYTLVIGTVELTDGSVIDVNDGNLVQDSLSINWQCLDNNDTLNFGGAVAAELSIGLFSDLSRYAFLDAKITLIFKLYLETVDNEQVFEEVPLGVFYVNDSEKNANRVTLTAYDALSKLDKPIGSHVFLGEPLDILTEICEMCEMTIGVDATSILNFPNHSENIQLDQTNGCTSFREVAMAVAQMLGAFVVADRLGRLNIRAFKTTSVDTLAEHHRYKFIPADYYCAYTSISITGLKGTFTANGSIPHPDMPKGLTMYMDDAPAWDYGMESTLQLRTQALMNYLQNLSYTPATLNMPNNPAYDCGDLITLVVGNSLLYVLVTEIQWTYRHPMDITSIGTNPYFNDVNGMRGESGRQIGTGIANSTLNMYSFINQEDLSFDHPDDWRTLIHLSFMAKTDTSVFFMANVTMDADIVGTHSEYLIPILNESGEFTSITTDDGSTLSNFRVTVDDQKKASIQFRYVLDSSVLGTDTRDHLIDKPNLESLFVPIANVAEQAVHVFDVQFKCGLGEVNQVTVNKWGIQASLLGQGLVDPAQFWDGIIAIAEQLAYLSFNIPLRPFTDSLDNISIYTPITEGYTEEIPQIPTTTLGLIEATEQVTIKIEYLSNVIMMSNVIPVEMGMWGWI